VSKITLILDHPEGGRSGYAIPGVEGVYDQYNYLDDKTDALKQISAIVAEIVHVRFMLASSNAIEC
jgi:hypothetical protein